MSNYTQNTIAIGLLGALEQKRAEAIDVLNENFNKMKEQLIAMGRVEPETNESDEAPTLREVTRRQVARNRGEPPRTPTGREPRVGSNNVKLTPTQLQAIHSAIKNRDPRLTATELGILERRFPLKGGTPMSLRNTAWEMGMSDATSISRYQRTAFGKLGLRVRKQGRRYPQR